MAWAYSRWASRPGSTGRAKASCTFGSTRRSAPKYDLYNVAVWAMRYEEVVLARVYQPRLNGSFVDVLAAAGDLPAGAADVTGEEMD